MNDNITDIDNSSLNPNSKKYPTKVDNEIYDKSIMPSKKIAKLLSNGEGFLFDTPLVIMPCNIKMGTMFNNIQQIVSPIDIPTLNNIPNSNIDGLNTYNCKKLSPNMPITIISTFFCFDSISKNSLISIFINL